MIQGLDSAFPPSPDTARRARAGGIDLWSGYISTAPYDGQSHYGLYHPWPREGFEYARLCGSTPIAFCSGWDSPGALKALAATWNVRLCLDIEGGIRPDGPWKQAWLDASGAGVYGNAPCHNCRAAFHILAAYPGSGDVQATWWRATPRPHTPCGWQWAGTHTEFGVGVDRGDYDDYFGIGGGDMDKMIQVLYEAFQGGPAYFAKLVGNPPVHGAWYNLVVNNWNALNSKLDAILAAAQGKAPAPSPDLTKLQADVAEIKANVDKLLGLLPGV